MSQYTQGRSMWFRPRSRSSSSQAESGLGSPPRNGSRFHWRLSRARKLMVAALVVATLAVTMVVTGVKPAFASATGCARWGAKHILGYSIPTGQYCFSIQGSGTTVNFTSGSFDTGYIEYPTEVVQFYDTSGNNYANFTTFQGQGTLYAYHYWQSGIHGTARVGSVCGNLLSYGQTVVRVCENIEP
jgi:hypothetical protein